MFEPFGVLLERFLDEENLSLNTFSKLIETNRGTIHGIISGDRKIDEEKFLRIIEKNIFSENKCTKLRYAYFAEEYGEQNFKRILFTLEKLSELAEERKNNPVLSSPVDIDKNGGFLVLNDVRSIHGAIRSMFEKAATEEQIILSNYTYENEDIDNTVYDLLSNSEKQIDFRHIIRLSDENRSKYNLKCLFAAIRYAYIRYSCRYKTVDYDFQCAYDGLYPYFFTSEKYVLLLNSDMTSGIYMCAGEESFDLYKNALNIYKDSKPLFIFHDNVLELRTTLENVYHYEKMFSINHLPCMPRFFDREVLDAIARPELKDRDVMIQMGLEWYSFLFNDSERETMSYCTSDGWQDFSETGIIAEFPLSMVTPVPPAVRRKLIEGQIELLKSCDDENSVVIDSRKMLFPRNFGIEHFGNNVAFVTRDKDSVNSFVGNGVAIINIKGIADDIEKMMDYIKCSSILCEKEKMINILSLLLNKCESDDILRNKIVFVDK